MIVELPLAHFPKGLVVEVGMKFNTTGPNGKVMAVRVIELEDNDIVVVDGNHPLAELGAYV